MRNKDELAVHEALKSMQDNMALVSQCAARLGDVAEKVAKMQAHWGNCIELLLCFWHKGIEDPLLFQEVESELKAWRDFK